MYNLINKDIQIYTMQQTDTIAMPKSWREKLEELDIDQSIPVEADDIQACRAASMRLHRTTDKKFSTRTIDGTGEVRVWRIK